MLALFSSMHRYDSWWSKDTQGWKLFSTQCTFTVGDPCTHSPANLYHSACTALAHKNNPEYCLTSFIPFIQVSLPTLTSWERAVSQRSDIFLIFHCFPLDSLPRLYCKKRLLWSHHLPHFLFNTLIPLYQGFDIILSRYSLQSNRKRSQIMVDHGKGNRRFNSPGLPHMLSEYATHYHFFLH